MSTKRVEKHITRIINYNLQHNASTHQKIKIIIFKKKKLLNILSEFYYFFNILYIFITSPLILCSEDCPITDL